MDFHLTNIVWAPDDWGLASDLLPSEVFVSWMNGCNTEKEAIDFVESQHYNGLIVSCNVVKD